MNDFDAMITDTPWEWTENPTLGGEGLVTNTYKPHRCDPLSDSFDEEIARVTLVLQCHGGSGVDGYKALLATLPWFIQLAQSVVELRKMAPGSSVLGQMLNERIDQAEHLLKLAEKAFAAVEK